MKKVVLGIESEVFPMDNIGKNHIVGIEWEGNHKGFLFEIYPKHVIAIDRKDLSRSSVGDNDAKANYPDKQSYLNKCFKGEHKGFLNAFVFASFDELYQWMKS